MRVTFTPARRPARQELGRPRVRLDADDAPAGAGPVRFHARCSFVEQGRVTYRGTVHVDYALLLQGSKPMRPPRYCLEAPVGPATLQVWPVYANAQLSKEIPKALKPRMQGKSCFNFTTLDDVPFDELDLAMTLDMSSPRRESRT